jgi:hypothetical protein
MSHRFIPLAIGTLAFFWLLLMLADYGWERRNRPGLKANARPGRDENRSEDPGYMGYWWVRYPVIILITYLNAIGLFDSNPRQKSHAASALRFLEPLFSLIICTFLLLAIDRYWDRKRPSRFTRFDAGLFWSYFSVRYPILILATLIATKHSLGL